MWFKVLDTFISLTLQFFILHFCAGEKDVYTCWCMPITVRLLKFSEKNNISRQTKSIFEHGLVLIPPPGSSLSPFSQFWPK